MSQSHRVIVTGINNAGKSVVVEDAQASLAGAGQFRFLADQARPVAARNLVRPVADEILSGPGGTMFRLFTIPPADPKMTPAEIAAMQDWFFKEVGDPDARVDTSRHPMMHVTPTVDYILLLSGEISLLLDEGEPIKLEPFDAVVQRATNHSWLNTGTEPALLMCVMVGGK